MTLRTTPLLSILFSLITISLFFPPISNFNSKISDPFLMFQISERLRPAYVSCVLILTQARHLVSLLD